MVPLQPVLEGSVVVCEEYDDRVEEVGVDCVGEQDGREEEQETYVEEEELWGGKGVRGGTTLAVGTKAT